VKVSDSTYSIFTLMTQSVS